jgi:hypothetical protein
VSDISITKNNFSNMHILVNFCDGGEGVKVKEIFFEHILNFEKQRCDLDWNLTRLE